MTITASAVHETINRFTAPSGPFAVGERYISGERFKAFTNAAETLPDLLAMLTHHGDREFLVFENHRMTYRQFMDDAEVLAAALQQEFKIRPGDRVAIAMRNCIDWMVIFAAAARIGAVVVPINSWGSAEELEFTVRDCGAKVMAADATRAALAGQSTEFESVDIILSDVEGRLDIEAHLRTTLLSALIARNRGGQCLPASPANSDTALLMYTSGSTGRPKGVIYRHVAIGQAIMNMIFLGALGIEMGGSMDLRGGATAESGLVTVPLFHATGLLSGFLLPGMLGQKVVLMRKWDAREALQLIAREKVTMMATVPAILKDLLTHPEFINTDVSSLSRISAAGAATPADLPGLVEQRLGIVIRSAGYGMTETTAMCAAMSGPVFDLAPLACGIPSPIMDVRIADTPDSDGIAGEVQLRGVTVTPGYWHQEAMTQQAFTNDGWLRTGDVGHIDENGFLHITGRIKDIVIRGGENIYPIEIENVAYRHPEIKEAAAFGVPDDTMGEELVLVCHPFDIGSMTEGDLRQHLAAQLPSFKVPKYILLSADPLPRNASEKIHRLALRNRFTDAAAR
ncbi:class I adenylate-forming enzyme family protein [Mycobacterium aquaticum]|uniref:Fatty acid--CoA ligase n=1 Tax=Mycobacterium aquaticum TaxID=1927124 RepID=A0A1X0AWN5_9MYCO|nr:class I adenylate-forming enzyme family protein [Mycobacterium aquaticum]ORA34484.1 hypothetical protein BST13_17245 [Mycobacterium aquaticum]